MRRGKHHALFHAPDDAVGRIGGEKFLIVLPGCDKINAVSHAERMRNAINRISVETSNGLPINVTASMGVTVVAENFDAEAADLIHTADIAIYAPKPTAETVSSLQTR